MAMIGVVILNWNRPVDTIRCLESLHRASLDGTEIIVVDNGSTDDSVDRVRSAFPGVTLIETGANLGYAEGNNTGVRHALAKGAKYIFVLNNDTEVAPDTIKCLLDAAAAYPKAAFFGPKILHLDEPGRVQSTGMELDFLWRSRQRDLDKPDDIATGTAYPAPEKISCITGAAVFLRGEALKEIGLLDPDFYLYREDVDWCLRARNCGYAIYYIPAARVWHRSHHIRESDLPRITYYMTRNSLLLLRKHRGGPLRSALLTFRFLLTAAAWSIRPRWKHKKIERDALLRGLRDFYRNQFGRGYV